jgi:hypothetical protein
MGKHLKGLKPDDERLKLWADLLNAIAKVVSATAKLMLSAAVLLISLLAAAGLL